MVLPLFVKVPLELHLSIFLEQWTIVLRVINPVTVITLQQFFKFCDLIRNPVSP